MTDFKTIKEIADKHVKRLEEDRFLKELRNKSYKQSVPPNKRWAIEEHQKILQNKEDFKDLFGDTYN